jgi:FlaA1/EpsC-like NDP-sugar epimerase
MVGGEIYVKKIPSMKITDIALAVAPEKTHKIIGIRPGEKLHEQMIGFEDAPHTYEYSEYFKILPAIHEWAIDPNRIKNGKKVNDNFIYSSDNNPQWMSIEKLQSWVRSHLDKIGRI